MDVGFASSMGTGFHYGGVSISVGRRIRDLI